jgi:hypothetical protein
MATAIVTPVRALTPGCLCFGSIGSVWSVRIYVKAARVGRSRLSRLAVALASLRYLVGLAQRGAYRSGAPSRFHLLQVSQENYFWLPAEKITGGSYA